MSNKMISLCAAYQESKHRMAQGTGDARDDALVSIYDQCLVAYKGRKEAQDEVKAYKASQRLMDKRLRTMQHEHDIATSRVAVFTQGSIPVYEGAVAQKTPQGEA
jgi:hypothetical protein